MIKKDLICRETLVSTRVRWAHKHSFLSSDSFFFHIVYRHHHHVVMWESAGSAKKDSQPNDKLRCCETARFKSNLQHFFSFEWWWWSCSLKCFAEFSTWRGVANGYKSSLFIFIQQRWTLNLDSQSPLENWRKLIIRTQNLLKKKGPTEPV